MIHPQLSVMSRVRCIVKSSENNTHVLRRFIDPESGGLCQKSGSTGKLGFMKSKRSSSYASEELIRSMFLSRGDLPVEKVRISVMRSGYGPGRSAVIKILGQLGYSIESVSEVTPFSHNGCRPKKPRRI